MFSACVCVCVGGVVQAHALSMAFADGAGPSSQGNGTNNAGGVGEDQVMGLNAADSYTLLTAASAGHVVGGARYFSGGGGGAVGTAGTNGAGGSGGNPGGGGGMLPSSFSSLI